MTKVLHKFFIGFVFSCAAIAQTFAAEIHFSADKTTGTTDDIFQVHLSIDGEVDGGKIGIKGLENFDIVGQQLSFQQQSINGKTSMIQEKILSLHPKKDGNFTLIALAKENGKEIQTKPISFSISKSLIQQTKENLLNNSQENNSTENKRISSGRNTSFNGHDNQQENIAKQLLTTSSNSQNGTPEQHLAVPEIKHFPKVEHISVFNGMFWLQFLGGIFLIVLVFWVLQKIWKK